MAYIAQSGYTGVVKSITASVASYVNFILVGAGGGGGGNDSRPGSAGTNGDVIRGRVFLNSGETLYCAVGQAGGAGTSGGNAAGAIGGYSLDGFSGGTGGNSGPGGWSGSGGGGGGATALWKLNGSTKNYIAIAGGGGGGGGGGNYSNGYIQSDYDPYGSAPKSDLYYPQAGYNGAWSSMLNTYGIWNGNGDYTYQFYFPQDAIYTFNLSIDNYGILYVDNVEVLRTQQNSSVSNYNSVTATTKYITAGWKTIRIYGVNTGGPGAIGATIVQPNAGIIWTTRNSYNAYDILANSGRGGKGQNHRGDGGGPGGGGGGFLGGIGGGEPLGDIGAPSGSRGYSFLAAGCDLENSEYEAYVDLYSDLRTAWQSSGLSKADYGRYHYRRYGFREGRSLSESFISDISGYSTLGKGGNTSTVGTNGSIVFYSVQSDITIYNDSWTTVREVKYYNNDVWVNVPEIYVRDADTWKRVYGNNISSLSNSTGTFTNTTGPMVDYPPPATSYDWSDNYSGYGADI